MTDGSTNCNCGVCTETVECEHIHPLIVEYLQSHGRRDDVVEGIVEHRRGSSYRDNMVAALRSQAIPRGSILRLTAQSMIHVGDWVRLLPDGKVVNVNQGPAIGIAVADSSGGKVEVRVSYIPVPSNPQVFTRDSVDAMLGEMQTATAMPPLGFISAVDFSKGISFTAQVTPTGVFNKELFDQLRSDAVPPKPLPRRKFRL